MSKDKQADLIASEKEIAQETARINELSPDKPQAVGVIFHDIIDENGIPCVSLQIQMDEEAQDLSEPTPAMWFAVYLGTKFKDGTLMAEVNEFVSKGQFYEGGDDDTSIKE